MANVVTVRGFDELDKALRDLPKEVQTRIMEPAIRAGGTIIKRGVVRRLHRRTGQTAAAIEVSTRTEGAVAVASIGASAASKRAFVLNFVERGTRAHAIAATGKRKGGQPVKRGPLALAGRGFGPRRKVKHPGTAEQSPMRRALAEDGPAAVKVLGQELYDGMAFYAERQPRPKT